MAEVQDLERLSNFKRAYSGMMDINDANEGWHEWRGRQYR